MYTLNSVEVHSVAYEEKDGVLVLNDQGGGVMSVSYDVAGTLRAQDHGHPPLIFDARGNGGYRLPHDHGRPPEPNHGLHSDSGGA